LQARRSCRRRSTSSPRWGTSSTEGGGGPGARQTAPGPPCGV
jgi:hypothetical protein